eukprot:3345574-Karenia_brevis.AAC.1
MAPAASSSPHPHPSVIPPVAAHLPHLSPTQMHKQTASSHLGDQLGLQQVKMVGIQGYLQMLS